MKADGKVTPSRAPKLARRLRVALRRCLCTATAIAQAFILRRLDQYSLQHWSPLDKGTQIPSMDKKAADLKNKGNEFFKSGNVHR